MQRPSTQCLKGGWRSTSRLCMIESLVKSDIEGMRAFEHDLRAANHLWPGMQTDSRRVLGGQRMSESEGEV